MKNFLVFCVLVLLSACASSVEQLNLGLSQLQGQTVETAVQYLGYPDAEQDIMDKKVYVWDTSGTYRVDVPKTSTITTPGGKSATVTYNQTSYNSYACRIRLFTSQGRVDAYDLQGDSAGCHAYAKQLEPLLPAAE